MKQITRRVVLSFVVLASIVVAAAAWAVSRPALQRLPTQRRQVSPAFVPGPGPVKIAFFDADGTLRVAPSGNVSANSASDVAILPMVAAKLALLASDGYLLAIVSNQGGIQQGHVTFAAADAALRRCMTLLAKKGGVFHYYDFAEYSDHNRKPETGMADILAGIIKKRLGREVDWQHSIMVGDSAWKKGVDTEPDGTPGSDFSNTDRLFAENVARVYGHCEFYHPRTFFGWVKYGVKNFACFNDLVKFLQEHPEFGKIPPSPKPRATPTGD